MAMKVKTTPGRVYAVTSANACTVTATTDEGATITLANTSGGQATFQAIGAEIDVSDDSAVVLDFVGGAVALSVATSPSAGSPSGGGGASAFELAQSFGFKGSPEEWLDSLHGDPGLDAFELWKDHTAQPNATFDDFLSTFRGAPGQDGAPGAPGPQGEPGSVDPEELQAAVSKAVAEQPEPIVLGEGADDNLNARSIELSEVHAPAGFEVAAVRLLARSGQSVSGAAVYLSVWEQVSGDNYRLLGVSTNAQAQVLEEWTVWHFEGLALGGKRVRWAALAAPDTPFGEASELYLRVKAREGDDSCVIHTSSAPFNYHPAMVIESVARDKFAPMSHVGDSSHITAEERTKWNGYQTKLNNKANSETLTNHTNNNNVHITNEERVKWNNAAESSGGFVDTGSIKGGNAQEHGVAVGNNSTAYAGSVAVGFEAQTTAANTTAVGYETHVTGFGSFALGAFVSVDKAGEGLLRVATQSTKIDDYATALKLVGAGSEVSTASLGGACGLGYKEKTAEYRYVKLKDIFDLAERAEELLALLGD